MPKDKEIVKTLKNLPLRVAITDYCNLNCVFCSNEGMKREQKNINHINPKLLKALLKTANKKLNQLSLTGGDPTLHPNILEILNLVDGFEFSSFFHTNGIALNEEIIKHLKGFKKVAVSIHGVNLNIWGVLTRGSEEQYKRVLANLDLLSHEDLNVEIKQVVVRGVNDDEKTLKQLLDFVNNYSFFIKFLNFEAIEKNQMNSIVAIDKIIKRLENLGCSFDKNQDAFFRGQTGYLPMHRFQYKDIDGVAIEIGCGSLTGCKNCWEANEIFVTPDLKLKPCHMSNKTFDLKSALEKEDEQGLWHEIIESRRFLSKMPGLNKEYWMQNE